MRLEIREARPDDAEAIVRILNPVGTAYGQARIRGQYVDEVIIEKSLAGSGKAGEERYNPVFSLDVQDSR
ncbi:MAG: hypothetical protein ND807_00010 [Vicinamibacterales bacterium]|nr:hypothetical protein [Vicinamibacterales bacterium]